ncbi:MAG: hypothetical protein LAP86_05275 [Acidobacteriia bacterium]|nr:hypothetical protein [Terriglobia bacterium]
MGIGHVAVALGASRAAPRLNVGWLVFAALLADFLLGIFAFFGLEHATVPVDYASRHYLLFDVPYSHGLLALLTWSLIFGFLASRSVGLEARRIWLVVGLVVLSHFLLDGLVHVAGLPLIGKTSPKLGLGLWNHMPLELALETAMAIVGIAVYWKLAGSSSVSRYGMSIFVLLFTAMTWSQLLVTTPPKAQQLNVSWMVAPVVLSAIACGLDRQRERGVLVGGRVSKP